MRKTLLIVSGSFVLLLTASDALAQGDGCEPGEPWQAR
jgi:hypothetical protein